jgi:hypothetical protein
MIPDPEVSERKSLYKTKVGDVKKGSESLTNNIETYLQERS